MANMSLRDMKPNAMTGEQRGQAFEEYLQVRDLKRKISEFPPPIDSRLVSRYVVDRRT